MTLRAFAVATALLVPPAAAQEGASEPMRVDGILPFGTIRRVMEPAYPTELKAAKAKVYLDVSGRVTFSGVLTDAIYAPGSDEAKLMVEPLRAVMQHWEFQTPTDNECQPTGDVVKNRVWFDFDDDRPRMSVTHVPIVAAKDRPIIKPLERKQPVYPRSMQQLQWQSYVFAKISIDPEGAVAKVVATAYPKQPGIDLTDFEREARKSLSQWKFNAAPELGRMRHGCFTLVFRLR